MAGLCGKLAEEIKKFSFVKYDFLCGYIIVMMCHNGDIF
jgi:hypothetical protein